MKKGLDGFLVCGSSNVQELYSASWKISYYMHFYVFAKCCYPLQIKSLLTYLINYLLDSPPLWATDVHFCLKLPQGLYYMSATAKALVRLHLCAGWSEPLLVAYVISALFAYAGSFLPGCLFKIYEALYRQELQSFLSMLQGDL